MTSKPKTEEEIRSLLVKTIKEHLCIDESLIVPTAKVQEDLGADSLDVVELTMALEDEFNLEIPDEDMSNLATVQDVQDYLVKQLAPVLPYKAVEL